MWWKDYSSGLWVQAASGGEAVTEKKSLSTCKPCTVATKSLRDKHETLAVSFREELCFYRQFCSLIRCSSSKDERTLTEDGNKYSALWTVPWACIFWSELELKRAGASIWSWLRQEGVTEALGCPRRRETLVPLPKGSSKPGPARVTRLLLDQPNVLQRRLEPSRAWAFPQLPVEREQISP